MSYYIKVFVDILNAEYSKRKSLDQTYSIRKFAKFLDISHSSLDRILKNNQIPKDEFIEEVGRKLDIKFPTEQVLNQDESSATIPFDEYRLIGGWKYQTVKQATKLTNFNNDLSYISQKTGIKIDEVEKIVKELVILGALEYDQDNLVVSHSHFINHPSYSDSEEMKEFMVKKLERSVLAYKKSKGDDNHLSQLTVASSPEKIEVANRLIRQFRDELSNYLNDGEKTKVYNMIIHLFPSINYDGE